MIDGGDSDSGTSPCFPAFKHLFDLGPGGELGKGPEKTEHDYTEFTLCFPTIKFPGSYAFSINFWNGISE